MKRFFCLVIMVLAICSPAFGAWSLEHQTDFSGISNTSSVGAGVTLTDGWIEGAGSVWSVNSGLLKGTDTDTNGYQTRFLTRPTSESHQDQRVVVRFPAGNLGNSTTYTAMMLRHINGTHNTCYLFQVTGSALWIYQVQGATPTIILHPTSPAWSYSSSDVYDVDCSVTGTSPTTCTITITDVTTSTQAYTNTITDSTSALQTSGVAGVVSWSNGGSASATQISTITTYQGVPVPTAGTLSSTAQTTTSITVANTGATGGTTPYTYNLYRSTTSGFTPGVGNLIASNVTYPYTDTGLTPATTYYYVSIVTDANSQTATSAQLTQSTSGAALSSGTISATGATSSTITLTSTAASGGTSPYTYQWYRSTTTGFTPGVGNAVSGATSSTLTDTGLTASTTYYYRLKTTDAASAVVTSNEASQATASPSAPTIGTLTATGTVSGITLSVSSGLSGGSGTGYSYNIYRGTSANFTANIGSLLATVSTMPYSDTTAVSGTQYFYGVIGSDSASSTVSANPSGLTGATFASTTYVSAARLSKSINIVFIGDSITYGQNLSNAGTVTGTVPPYWAAFYLKQLHGIHSVNAANKGVSGKTAYDWRPGGSYYSTATAAMTTLNGTDATATQVFSIMLGDNDSADGANNGTGAAATASDYYTAIRNIVNQLLTDFPSAKIILNAPTYYSPNTSIGTFHYNQSGLDLVAQYGPQLATLASSYSASNPGHVYMGDQSGFRYFAENYQTAMQAQTDGNNGTYYIHPNATGAEVLGRMWASAIDLDLNQSGTSTAHAFAY